MNRIRQGWDALRRGRRSGVSLVIALCAVAVLIGLSLSIVYSSSMLLSRANRKIGRERCYQLAQSFAQVLDSELTAYNTERTDLGGADDKWPQTTDGTATFYQYANSVLENLDAYDADDPEHTTYYYSAGDEDDDYGKVTVMLRKQNTDSEQNPADRTGSFSYTEKDRQTAEISAQTFIRYQLSVSVRVEKGADSFTYTTEYYRRDGFQPIYTWEGEGESITPVYWVSPYFSRSHSIADRLEPKTDEAGQTRMFPSATAMTPATPPTRNTSPSTNPPEVPPNEKTDTGAALPPGRIHGRDPGLGGGVHAAARRAERRGRLRLERTAQIGAAPRGRGRSPERGAGGNARRRRRRSL